jgi:hypothetical protein
MSVTEVSAKPAPPALPAPPAKEDGIPASLMLGNPAALRPGSTTMGNQGRGNYDLDRVVSMYYDRRPSDPAAPKDWL